MFNNIIFKNTYKIYYIENNKKYFSFAKKNRTDNFTDIITNKIIQFKNVYMVECDNIKDKNCSIIKYYKYLYNLKNKDQNVFEVETNQNLNCYFYALRFFDLTYDDLFILEQNNEKILLIKEKIKKYVFRYLDDEEYKNFSDQIDFLKTIPSLLSFFPAEILDKVTFFWSTDYVNNENFKKILFRIEMEHFKVFNKYDLDWELLFLNKNEYKNVLDQKFELIKQNIKNEFSEKLKKRLNDGFETLNIEEKEASESKNEDFLIEINIIRELLKDIEKNYNFYINNFSIDKDLISIWPEILLPIPDLNYFYDYLKFKELLDWIYVTNSD